MAIDNYWSNIMIESVLSICGARRSIAVGELELREALYTCKGAANDRSRVGKCNRTAQALFLSGGWIHPLCPRCFWYDIGGLKGGLFVLLNGSYRFEDFKNEHGDRVRCVPLDCVTSAPMLDQFCHSIRAMDHFLERVDSRGKDLLRERERLCKQGSHEYQGGGMTDSYGSGFVICKHCGKTASVPEGHFTIGSGSGGVIRAESCECWFCVAYKSQLDSAAALVLASDGETGSLQTKREK